MRLLTPSIRRKAVLGSGILATWNPTKFGELSGKMSTTLVPAEFRGRALKESREPLPGGAVFCGIIIEAIEGSFHPLPHIPALGHGSIGAQAASLGDVGRTGLGSAYTF